MTYGNMAWKERTTPQQLYNCHTARAIAGRSASRSAPILAELAADDFVVVGPALGVDEDGRLLVIVKLKYELSGELLVVATRLVPVGYSLTFISPAMIGTSGSCDGRNLPTQAQLGR
jgi:hypothetical protein